MAAGLLLTAAGLGAQTVREFRGELSAAFGSVPGRIILAGDRMIFLDEQRPEGSFFLNAGDIQNVSSSEGVLTIQLARPVRDREGERQRLAFRLPDQQTETALTTWQRSAGSMGSAARGRTETGGMAGTNTYSARWDKRFGGSNGRLVITNDKIAFESLDDVKDSREWNLADIKKIRQKGPYELELESFKDGDYKFMLSGQGMSAQDYSKLADRIAQMRSNR